MGEPAATAKHAVVIGAGATAPAQEYRRAFPGRADQVRRARRFLTEILADCPAGLARGCPATDDAVLCLSELAANSAIHSQSARPGGSFEVRVIRSATGRLRVEVLDEGGEWTWAEPRDHTHGRGFVIVASLAMSWGHEGDPAAGWRVWFEMDCPAA